MAGDSVLGQDAITGPKTEVGGIEGFEPGGVYNKNDVYPHEFLEDYARAHAAGDTEAMEYLHKKLVAHSADYSKRAYNPASGMGGGELAVAGAQHDILRGGRGLDNLMHLPIPGTSDEELKESDKLDAPLMARTPAKAGGLAGQVITGGPVGSASSSLRATLAGLQGGGGALVRAGTRAGLAGGENAIQAASLADPEHQGEAATTGAEVGSGLSVLGSGLSKTLQGLTTKSEAAKRLTEAAAAEERNLFIPISQGGTGASKAIYQKALPYALGVESRLKGQSERAKGVMEEVAAEHAMPAELDSAGQLQTPKAPIGQTMEQTAANLKGVYDKAYQNTVKSYAFRVPENFQARVLEHLADHQSLSDAERNQISGTLDEMLRSKAGKDGTINGAQLTDVMKKARIRLTKMQDEVGDEASTNKAVGAFHDIIDDAINEHLEMSQGPKALKGPELEKAKQVVTDLTNYKKLGESYGAARAVRSTAEGNVADRGQLKFGKLAAEAPPESPLRRVAQDTHEVLEKENPGSVSPAGRHFLHTFGAVAPTAAALGHPGLLATGAGALGAGHLLANESTQKFLYGDFAKQQMLSKLLRENPNLAYQMGLVGREAATDAAR